MRLIGANNLKIETRKRVLCRGHAISKSEKCVGGCFHFDQIGME